VIDLTSLFDIDHQPPAGTRLILTVDGHIPSGNTKSRITHTRQGRAYIHTSRATHRQEVLLADMLAKQVQQAQWTIAKEDCYRVAVLLAEKTPFLRDYDNVLKVLHDLLQPPRYRTNRHGVQVISRPGASAIIDDKRIVAWPGTKIPGHCTYIVIDKIPFSVWLTQVTITTILATSLMQFARQDTQDRPENNEEGVIQHS
jgi:hypothetical protein